MKRREPVIVDGEERWVCNKCKEAKPRDDFYASSCQLSGIKSECKKCHYAMGLVTLDKERHRAVNAAHMRRARVLDPEKFRARARIKNAKQPKDHKYDARRALGNAVRRGDIVLPEHCSACGKPCRVHGHHTDYSKPLDVMWLCAACHGKEHRGPRRRVQV